MKQSKVLVGGRFNIIHPGHVQFLKKARSLGTRLVVVIASDSTIKSAKKSLLFSAKDRKSMIESLKWVDRVVIGYGIRGVDGYRRILGKERPDIVALGYDQRVSPARLERLAEQWGTPCRVVRIKRYKGYETKKIMTKK